MHPFDVSAAVIVGAIEERVQSLDEVMYLLECGSAARHTASTQMNEYSSRSHSVFTVVIGQFSAGTILSTILCANLPRTIIGAYLICTGYF